MRVAILLTCLVAVPLTAAAQIPTRALQYRKALTASARQVWGIDAPIAAFAAQVHQESGWRPDARSPYAGGLAQFTPATAADISRKYPELAGNAPYEPVWALLALARYDHDLFALEPQAATDCERWGFTLSAYNGGRGNVIKQKAAARAGGADQRRWFGNVERFRVRAPAMHEENIGYPRRILLKYQALYLAALWGSGVPCEVV